MVSLKVIALQAEKQRRTALFFFGAPRPGPGPFPAVTPKSIFKSDTSNV
jgi:hypothetical protein